VRTRGWPRAKRVWGGRSLEKLGSVASVVGEGRGEATGVGFRLLGIILETRRVAWDHNVASERKYHC